VRQPRLWGPSLEAKNVCSWRRAAISARASNDARLGTLFLTMPIARRGTLAQYAGRLHRLHASKRNVIIYDYVDENEPLFAKMAKKQEAGYPISGTGLSRLRSSAEGR